MKGTIDKEIFRRYMEMVGVLKDEADFSITEDGINVKAIDPANVCLVKAYLGKEAFEQYESGLPKALKGMETKENIDIVCLPVGKIIEALKLAGSKLEITSDKKKGLFSITSDNICNKFRMMSENEKEPSTKVDEFNFLVNLSLKAEVMKKAVKASKMLKGIGNVVFECNPFGLKISSEDKGDSVDIDIGKDDCKNYTCEKPCSSGFSIDYLSTIFSKIHSSDIVTLSLSKDYPLKIEYDGKVSMKAEYYLAPRIVDDSDFEPEKTEAKQSVATKTKKKGKKKKNEKEPEEAEPELEVKEEEE